MQPIIRKVATITFASALAATTLVVPATSASASLACQAYSITINSNPGAEPPSSAAGHRHSTGNHYVKGVVNSVWYWWADNNGGSDGDTWDTAYGIIQC